MNKAVSILWRAGAALLAVAGLAGFLWLFAGEMNLYWFILAPVILAVYEIPAVVVYALWKKAREAGEGKNGDIPGPENEGGP